MVGTKECSELSFGQVEGFFVDACVLLPHSIDSVKRSCLDFLRENASRCLLSSSVKSEAICLIEKSHSLILSELHSNLKPFLEKHEIRQLSNRHGRVVAQFFMERRRVWKKGFKSSIPREIVGVIENYCASRLHSLENGEKIDVDNFIALLITELTLKKRVLQGPFKGIRAIEVNPDASIASLIVLRTLLVNEMDAQHLASAVTFQLQNDKWVIFVTTDDTEILSREDKLFQIFALQCSSPEWASDYYVEMTKMKAPIEYFREIPKHSDEQKEFAGKIEKAIGIKIIG